jgi:hypothetical protein
MFFVFSLINEKNGFRRKIDSALFLGENYRPTKQGLMFACLLGGIYTIAQIGYLAIGRGRAVSLGGRSIFYCLVIIVAHQK